MTHEDMRDAVGDLDLFALAPDEGEAEIECHLCGKAYVVQGGYQPHYTSGFCEDQLLAEQGEG